LLLGRSVWAQSENGAIVPGQPTLVDVAQALAAQGVRVTGVITPARTQESGIVNVNGNLYPSWQELANLRDQYGWSFVSNGQNRVDITTLPPDQQLAESCGSLAAFTAHGHTRAWGLYGPGSNAVTDDIATNVVGMCFAFTRLYAGTNLNDRATVTTAPYYVRTDDTHGGACNLAPCSGTSGNASGSYMLPGKLAQDLQAARPDQWVVLSTYKLLTGSKLTGNRRWDCVDADPLKHWTSEDESYCLADLQAALSSIKPGSVVTDPATVAEAWGRIPGGTPPTTTIDTSTSTSTSSTSSSSTSSTSPTTSTIPSTTTTVAGAVDTTVTSPTKAARISSPVTFSGSASAGRGVVAVRVGVQDRGSGQWLRPDGSFGPYTTLNASVASPTTTSTTWSIQLALPAGSYGVSARTMDATGLLDATDAWVTFTVV
jgi:hypothetical protein